MKKAPLFKTKLKPSSSLKTKYDKEVINYENLSDLFVACLK